MDEPPVIDLLVKYSLILYIRVTEKAEEDALISRAQSSPKPLYYRPAFLEEQLQQYLELHGLEYAAQVDPDDFCSWVFPRLFHSRVPRYEAIARPHGYTVTSHEVAAVRDEMEPLARHANVTIDVECPGKIPAARGDTDRVEQIRSAAGL